MSTTLSTRIAGSITATDIGRRIETDTVRGTVSSVRHYRIDNGPAAGVYTSVMVQVAVTDSREPDHRELRVAASTGMVLGPRTA